MMLDKKGSVIYIGKAVNLKERIRSYFNTTLWKDRPKLAFMMPKVKEITTIVTKSEKEALILEANLVNKYQPKYNVTLKDDKKFPWLMITYDEKFPRIVLIRDVVGFKKKYPDSKNKFFGPYTDSGAMWETYKVLKEGFLLRIRKTPLFKDRPCINYHIGLCSGPCQGLVSYDDYHKLVKQVENFLLGKYDVVLQSLKSQMDEASKKLQYEQAAKFRNTIQKIKKVLENQIVVSDNHTLNQDVFACDFQANNMILELLVIREGKIVAIESLTTNLPQETKIEEAFTDAIKQYYTRIENDKIPNEIIVQYELTEKGYVEEWLSSILNLKVKIICPKKGKKLELVKLAKQNARWALQKLLLSKIGNVEELTETSLQNLQSELELKHFPRHIECFDVSHLGGTGTVGSMVCFIDGKPDKTQYRKFKLQTVLNKIDDYEAMRETITRRYKNTSMPDLIIIDGGRGQLNAAKGILDELEIDLSRVDLISLAKKREEIFKPNTKNPILLDRKSKALHLLQRVRDEAHRFAIAYQKERRKIDTFKSC